MTFPITANAALYRQSNIHGQTHTRVHAPNHCIGTRSYVVRLAHWQYWGKINIVNHAIVVGGVLRTHWFKVKMGHALSFMTYSFKTILKSR